VDVFYVKDGFGMKITHEAKLAGIRKTLLEAIHEDDQSAPARAAAE
jgi:[protein-PII] uridylyltransferase